ncbi:solute carrier family 66 member 3-like [Ruditapes philippinarum]|uniref:solute carrier family 66 member 3-like n=1 Tax=Ruditapes philippinarum TaxID=129788 RepID=UPI00295AC95C|nr:solute carrier family 66 member 3-like [Ruditapes philippinarum]
MSVILENFCYILNWSVVLICLFLKVPQMKSCFGSMDTNGISLQSVLLEMLGYSVLFCYSFAMDYPISLYLEQGLLLVQNIFILGLIIYTRKLLSTKLFYIFVIYIIICYCLAFRLVPELILKSAVFTKTPLVVMSKLSQIRALYKSKTPGTLSATTWGMAAYGSFARLFSSLVMTKDWLLLLNYTCAGSLSSTVVAMILYYTKKTHKHRND